MNRLFGDLVKDHSLDRDLWLQNLKQVPGNGFTLAVFICCQEHFVGTLEGGLELGDRLRLTRADRVVRLEVVLDVDRELSEWTLL